MKKSLKLPAKPSFGELQAHKEAINQRVTFLRTNYGTKLPVHAEPTAETDHREYFLRELEWMSVDFDKERKSKRKTAKRFAKAVIIHLRQKENERLRLQREEEKVGIKIAKINARMVGSYWKSIARLVEYKQKLEIDEQMQMQRDQKLNRFVEKQLKLSQDLAENMTFCPEITINLARENGKLSVVDVQRPTEPTTRKIRIPFLLKGRLRQYQMVGLDWLVTLHDKKLNGILADEMGLGKTIQTIAILAYLACERGIWGPHLIVVPTSLIINWEMEIKRWCPGLKVMTYFGSQKERKQKRSGWSKPNKFHICITSYKLIIQDQFMFRRKQWYYMILDEAQHLKNFRSQRWQTLLQFASKRRLLLTGTPLQNDVMELWSLLHFLMPQLFNSHDDFKEWFSNPFADQDYSDHVMIRLHSILRPFLLRRLKKDVEKQLPDKVEHIIYCPLSRRQQYLYDEFLEKRDNPDDKLTIMNVLMYLRKVCNHPDLFAPREVLSPLRLPAVEIDIPKAYKICMSDDVRILPCEDIGKAEGQRSQQLMSGLDFTRPVLSAGYRPVLGEYKNLTCNGEWGHQEVNAPKNEFGVGFISPACLPFLGGVQTQVPYSIPKQRSDYFKYITDRRVISRVPIYGQRFIDSVRRPVKGAGVNKVLSMVVEPVEMEEIPIDKNIHALQSLNLSEKERFSAMEPILDRFQVFPPKLVVHPKAEHFSTNLSPHLHKLLVRRNLLFPNRMSIEHDWGKLRMMSELLGVLKQNGHRCLLFTQMTRMLDIFEKFLNIHGHSYVRLDGSTKVETRQKVVDRFNFDEKIFCFISSTRSGGLGINLTGADTVIFYDTDWNPAMDKQAQDRCHRIGQTRQVHIYRLISEYTIEENILRRSIQKRQLDDMVLQEGKFNTEFFSKFKVQELFENDDHFTELCEQVEDEEDIAAMRRAQLEEETNRVEKEFEEEGAGSPQKYDFYSQLDPISIKAMSIYEEQFPVEFTEAPQLVSEDNFEVQHSESEEIEIELCEDGKQIYLDHADLLRRRYSLF